MTKSLCYLHLTSFCSINLCEVVSFSSFALSSFVMRHFSLIIHLSFFLSLLFSTNENLSSPKRWNEPIVKCLRRSPYGSSDRGLWTQAGEARQLIANGNTDAASVHCKLTHHALYVTAKQGSYWGQRNSWGSFPFVSLLSFKVAAVFIQT